MGWVRGRKVSEKIFVIHWGWTQKGKGDFGRFPVSDLGMRWGDWNSGIIGKMWAWLQPTCCAGSSPLVSRGWLLRLGSGQSKREIRKVRIHRGGKQGVREGCHGCFTEELDMRLGGLDLEEQSIWYILKILNNANLGFKEITNLIKLCLFIINHLTCYDCFLGPNSCLTWA